jgi:hypothetical protein
VAAVKRWSLIYCLASLLVDPSFVLLGSWSFDRKQTTQLELCKRTTQGSMMHRKGNVPPYIRAESHCQDRLFSIWGSSHGGAWGPIRWNVKLS